MKSIVPNGGPERRRWRSRRSHILRGTTQSGLFYTSVIKKHVICKMPGNHVKGGRRTGSGRKNSICSATWYNRKEQKTGEKRFEITERWPRGNSNQRWRGGLGNEHFKTSTNQCSTLFCSPERLNWGSDWFRIQAPCRCCWWVSMHGKSTLISSISAARTWNWGIKSIYNFSSKPWGS